MRDNILSSGPNGAPFRLPEDLKPLRYDIEVEPDLATSKLYGIAVIQLEVVEPTNVIVFNARELDITGVSLDCALGKLLNLGAEYAPEKEIAFVKLPAELPRGSTATLRLEYVGRVNEPGAMGGLFPTPYQLPGGELKWGYETMFQPNMARTVYPCLDEPDRKAVFGITMLADPEQTCLSNMPATSRRLVKGRSGGQKQRVEFGVTPKMSTYLFVIVAGYFNCLSSDDFHVPVRVWVPVDKAASGGAYALEIAVKALRAHEKNFQLEFPLPKVDIVALSGHGGGMEHWGCVTCAVGSIVLNETPSVTEKQQLELLLVHELAHQWFGNIVTSKTWGSIWLNESFSDWATLYAMTQIDPEFDAWAGFLANDPTTTGGQRGYEDAMVLDANRATHPILDPSIPADAAFDAIAYLKGCSIIRMLAEDLTAEVFLKGVSRYLKQHLFGNAETEDLWAALSEVSGRDVAAIMTAWTTTPGYPVLTVREIGTATSTADDKVIRIEQSRFLQNSSNDNDEAVWPLSILTKISGDIERHAMPKKKLELSVPDFDSYKLNVDQVGFYRVSYPLTRVQRFGAQFHGNFLSVHDKIGILSDVGATVFTGAAGRDIRLSHLLDFLLSLKHHEPNVFVWREILTVMYRIRNAFLFEGDTVERILRSVRHELLEHVLTEVTMNREGGSVEPKEKTLLRATVFSQLWDHPVGQAKAKAAWEKLLEGDLDAIDPDLRRSTFETVLYADSTDKTWETMKSIAVEQKFVRSTDPVTPLVALGALGSNDRPELVARAVALLLATSEDGAGVAAAEARFDAVANGRLGYSIAKPQAPLPPWRERLSIFRSLHRHATGAQAAWDWLRDEWDALADRRGAGGINGTSFIDLALKGLGTWRHLAELREFFADKTEESFEMALRQAADTITAKARFVDADREDLMQWAKARGLA